MRRSKLEDAEELGRALKVVVDEGRWLATENPITAAELADRVRQRFGEGHIQFVLEDDGVLVGEAALAARPPEAHKIELDLTPRPFAVRLPIRD